MGERARILKEHATTFREAANRFAEAGALKAWTAAQSCAAIADSMARETKR